MTTVHADLNLCRGYANCVMTAPDYFDLENNGDVKIVRADVAEADLPAVSEAVLSCPVSALRLEQV